MNERTTRIVLALSLVLNVFAVGAAAGGAYVWWHLGANARSAAQGLATAAQDLGSGQQEILQQALADARRQARPDAQAARASRIDVAGLLGEPTLDRAAIDAALAATRDADMKVRGRVEGAVVDFAAGLNAGDRARLVDALAARGQMLRRAAKN